jgi:hypothetical protein
MEYALDTLNKSFKTAYKVKAKYVPTKSEITREPYVFPLKIKADYNGKVIDVNTEYQFKNRPVAPSKRRVYRWMNPADPEQFVYTSKPINPFNNNKVEECTIVSMGDIVNMKTDTASRSSA